MSGSFANGMGSMQGVEPRLAAALGDIADAVVVTARIVDESPSGLTVTLFHRVDAATPPAFSSVVIITEASLSFLGIGTQPPNPSWGNIIRDALGNIFGSPWPIIGAGAAITIVVLAFNILGDALRDLLDPEGR